jgi:hypothetical protein
MDALELLVQEKEERVADDGLVIGVIRCFCNERGSERELDRQRGMSQRDRETERERDRERAEIRWRGRKERKEGKCHKEPSSVEGEVVKLVWVCRRTDTNRPININQLQRCIQLLTAMKTQSTGLHKPNESSKMMLFTVLEII